MLLINFLGIFYFNENTIPFFALLNKILYGIYIIWHTILFVYLANITDFKYKRLLKYGYTIIDAVLIILIFISPIDLYFENYLSNSSGPSANFLYVGCLIYLILILLLLIKNIKNAKNKKFFPIYVLFLMQSITMIIRLKDPLFNISSNALSLVALIMYFTIENPDIQMLEELSKNKRIIEKQNEDTSNFLFRITQEVKKPVKELIEITDQMSNEKTLKNIKTNAYLVNKKAKDLDFLISEVLDLNTLTTGNIKIINSRYNFYNLMSEIKIQTENILDKNVKLEYYVNNNIPKMLYGDSIKLKQIVTSIINNSIKHVKSGYISIEVDSLVKYDTARIMISISDTGSGIPIEEINNILSYNIDSEKLNIDMNNKNLSLKEVKKVLPLIDGSMNIKSEPGKGTTVSLVVNQKIVKTEESEINKKIFLYEQSLHKNKKILVMDGNSKELSQVKKILELLENDVSTTLYSKDVLGKIKSNYKYDLIILNDENKDLSAYDILKELKKDSKFKTPVIIMINDDKEFIKLHYLKDGFSDVILKSKLKEDIIRIMQRY